MISDQQRQRRSFRHPPKAAIASANWAMRAGYFISQTRIGEGGWTCLAQGRSVRTIGNGH